MIALSLALLAFAAPRDEPTLTATWNTTTVEVGEHAMLDVVVRGECAVDAELLALPELDGATLSVASGPDYASDGAYRCSWRIDALARRAGALDFTLRVQCQSAEVRSVVAPTLTIRGGAVIEPEARFTLTPSSPRVYASEPFAIDVEVRLSLRAFANGYTLVLPWFKDVLRIDAAAVGDPVTFAIDGEPEPMHLSRTDAGDALIARTTLHVAAPQAGRLTWAGSRLRPLAHGGSRPAGAAPRDVPVAAGEVDVVPLPAEGRPAGHVDAIGVWSVRSSAERVDVAVGEPIRVEVVIEAQGGDSGNLRFATLPDAWAIDGCVATLREDRRDAHARTRVFEVRATRADAQQIASYEIATFDPRTRRYVSGRSEPIPLRVREGGAAVPEQPRSARSRLALFALLGAGCGLLAAWASVAVLRARARRRARRDPRRVFERICAEHGLGEPLRASRALCHAIAVLWRIDVGALGGGGAREVLHAAGVGSALTERVAQLIDVDEAAAFAGGRAQASSENDQRLDEAKALVEALIVERAAFDSRR